MAYQDRFYTIGDVTVQNGSAVVTGTGTGWETALIDGGVIFVGGGSYPIYSVESETSLTLAYPFTGESGADLPYAVDRQRAAATSNIQMNDRLAQIIREISIGNIEDLNAIDFTGNELLQTNAAGVLIKVALAANKLLCTNANKNIEQIELIALPISTAMQSALNDKLSLSAGGIVNGPVRVDGALYTYVAQTAQQRYSNQVSCFIGDQIAGRFLAEHAPGEYYATMIQTAFPGGSREFLFKSDGSFTAPGAIIGAAKNFEIDHTVDPDNYDLRHCATESDEMGLHYRGRTRLVNGRATVNVEEYRGVMPGTYMNLWADAWVSSILKTGPKAHVSVSEIDGATFELICEDETSNDLVSWLVTARRNDPYVRWEGCISTDAEGKLIVEFEKETA
ncbi:hypothetical protein OIV19_20505 [Brucella sp. HL-2]|nr:hypothetical protein [Brucella sp. HL-2]MCV9909984.1 hypothetical protein [Brucella sp. HL-2]